MNIDRILDIENKYQLYTDEIEGAAYWMFLRFGILQYQIIKDIVGNKTSIAGGGRKKSVISKAANRIYASLLNLKTRGAHSDIAFLPHSRRILTSGKFREIYTDGFAEEYKAVSIIDSNDFEHIPIASPCPVFYYDFPYGMKNFIRKRLTYRTIRKKRQRIYNEAVQHLSQPLKDIADAYGITIDCESIYEQTAGFITYYQAEHEHCTELLRKINPKVLVIVVHYGGLPMFMCEAARKLGIKVIELQHGTMHTEHIGYHYRTDEKLIQLPDFIFTFSDYWHDFIEMPCSSTKLIAAGFPYYEEQKALLKDTMAKAKSQSLKFILFISQGTVGNELSKFAVELNRKLDPKRFRIIYKLHSGERNTWREQYRSLAAAHDEGRLEVIYNTENSIYQYFALSSVQVGV